MVKTDKTKVYQQQRTPRLRIINVIMGGHSYNQSRNTSRN